MNRSERRAQASINRTRAKDPDSLFLTATKDEVTQVMRELAKLHSEAVTDQDAEQVETMLAMVIHESMRKLDPKMPHAKSLDPRNPDHLKMISVDLASALVFLQGASTRPISKAGGGEQIDLGIPDSLRNISGGI